MVVDLLLHVSSSCQSSPLRISDWIFGAILRRGLKSKISVSTCSNPELLGDEGLLHLLFTTPSTFTVTQSPSCTLLSPTIYHLSCCAVLKGSLATSPHSLTPVYLAMSILDKYDTQESKFAAWRSWMHILGHPSTIQEPPSADVT